MGPRSVVWTVKRRWLPHRDGIGVRQRFRLDKAKERGRWFDSLDGASGCFDFGDSVAVVIGLLVALVLLFFVFPPLLLVGIDLIWLVVVFFFSAIGRLVLGRPWSVVAVAADGERREWKVKGFRGSGQLRDTLQAEFDAGLDPRPDNLGE